MQTKRGPITKQRIIDWIVWDVGATAFPTEDRDNYGELLGLIDSKLEWHIGDRTALTSNYLYDPGADTRSASGAIHFQRPPRTNFSVFFSHFDSTDEDTNTDFKSNYLGVAGSYRFSHRYAGYMSVGHDLETNNDISFAMGFTRIGLDFVGTLEIVYNSGRDDLGIQFDLYPRVQARSRQGRSNLPTTPFGIDLSEGTAASGDRLSDFNNNFATN